jgi:hypothetical protein
VGGAGVTGCGFGEGTGGWGEGITGGAGVSGSWVGLGGLVVGLGWGIFLPHMIGHIAMWMHCLHGDLIDQVTLPEVKYFVKEKKMQIVFCCYL